MIRHFIKFFNIYVCFFLLNLIQHFQTCNRRHFFNLYKKTYTYTTYRLFVYMHLYIYVAAIYLKCLYNIGCSTPDHYGEDCNQSCPDHCNNSRCQIDTGHCFECENGYQGPKCEQRTHFK